MESSAFARMLPNMALVAGALALLGSVLIFHQPARASLDTIEPAAGDDAEQEPKYVEKATEWYHGLSYEETADIWNANKPFYYNAEDWKRRMSRTYTVPYDGLVGPLTSRPD